MDKDYTHISLIIDRSGSMSDSWSDVCGGYEALVRENKAASGKCTMTVAAFDDRYELVEDFTDISKVKSTLNTSPRGMTALFDAIGKTVVSVGEKLATMKEKDRPSKVIVMIQTDGLENVSKEFTKHSIKKLVKEQEDKYDWQFLFIGASLEAAQQASDCGLKLGNISTYSIDSSRDAFATLGTKMSAMRGATTKAAYMAASAFSEEEVKIMNKVG